MIIEHLLQLDGLVVVVEQSSGYREQGLFKTSVWFQCSIFCVSGLSKGSSSMEVYYSFDEPHITDNESTNGGSSRINYDCRFIKHNSFAHGYNTRHIEIVNCLLHVGSSIVTIARSNSKTALHSAARNGHVEVMRALLEMEPLLATRTEKKVQTTLHMASKGYEFHVYISRLLSYSTHKKQKDSNC
ncbi:hypothetical protein ACFE04_028545 [Oxalis oulophora]